MANGCDNIDYIAVPGPRGEQGPKGDQGIQGVQGPQGPQGERGLQGIQGCQGPKGDRGARGEQGPKGERGDNGRDGAPGPQGPEGPRGCKGADGTVQFDELTDDQIEMLRGPQGLQGIQGERGPIGPQGPQGATGLQGPKGDTGANGPQGPKGNDGDIGPQGPRGLQGAKGDKGDSGIGHDDHIGENSTWNSKTIVDYALHGKVRWEEHSLYQSNISNTANGFAKDLVVHGRTMVNYINEEKFKNPVLTTEKIETAQRNGHTLYTVKDGKPEMKGPSGGSGQPAKEPFYTLIYNMKVTSAEIGVSEGDSATILVTSGNGQVTTYHKAIQEGINKLEFSIPLGKPTEIRVQFYVPIAPNEDESHQLNFTIEKAMLLEGAYENAIVPRYFWGTRGVGDKIKGAQETENKRELILEARNKNLLNPAEIIDDFYLQKAQLTPSENVLRWAQGSKGDNISFLVYVKQGEHTLSVRAKHGMGRHLRFFVAGFGEMPTNGETANTIYFEDDNSSSEADYISKSFRVNANTNVLAIYIANLIHDPQDPQKPDGTIHHEWKVSDVIDFMQLETGKIQTEPVPYKSIEKRIIIPRQLMDQDFLIWDDVQGQYVINNELDPSIHEPTGIKEETFLHTFEDMTHVYVKNKIASMITARFPIKIDGEHIYKKEEWAFEGENALESNEDRKNFLMLPNGVAMFWRVVRIKGKNNPNEVLFLGAKKIIHAQATLKYNNGAERKDCVVSAEISRPNAVKIRCNDDIFNGVGDQAYLFVISDNRDFDEM